MAYTNAFTLGACTLRVYKSFDAGFPVIGFSLVDPGDYAAEGINISEAGGVVTASLAVASTATYIFVADPTYAVGTAPARLTLAGDLGLDTLDFKAIKTTDFSALLYNQSTLSWSGATNQVIDVNTYIDIPEEDEVLFIAPNPANLTDVVAWSQSGYFISNDGPITESFTFTLEIDGVTPEPSVECFWHDVIGATQNCIPA